MSKGKRYKKSKSKVIFILLELIFITIFIICAYKLIKYIIETKETNKIIDTIEKSVSIEIEDNEEKYHVDFESLKSINSDTVGFLKVNGTNIETSVVKAKDNSYYLKHNFNKEYNASGWIFADCNNKFDGTDKNIVIYGHNMRNNTMFGTLKNILDDEWCSNEENRTIILVTENGECKYQVFSAYKIENEDYYITKTFKENEFAKFIKKIKERSYYDFDTDVTEDDNILTLSTCANNNKYRVVLHAKLIK